MIKDRRISVLNGFTLVELMVSIAILALIVVSVAQIISTASTVTTVGNKHIDANSQARTVFDRMATDFAQMVKRNDVDFIFFKATGNDTMFFFTEGPSYFDNSTFSGTLTGYSSTIFAAKNRVSLVGYRVNNGSETSTPPGPTYYQLERLGKALSWDGYTSFNPVVFLTYPPAGTDVSGDQPPNGFYSTAFFDSTLYGGYSNGSGSPPSLVGTLANNFNDGADNNQTTPENPYRSLGSQVFRFEFAFQLKDGTQSVIPVMTPSTANGLPVSNLTATGPPIHLDDSANDNGTGNFVVGSRWYDTADQIGYICVDPTAGYAIWQEIGIRDIAAVVVTIAVMDKQGQIFANQNPTVTLPKLVSAFPDVVDGTTAASVLATWTTAITPSAGTPSAVSSATGIPQRMVSQIRIYQRYFYINNL